MSSHPSFRIRAVALISLLAAVTCVSFAANEQTEPETGRRASRREGLPADTERRPSPLGLFDTDRDGVISAAEIAAAPEVLRRLDRDKDGKLAGDELLPRRPRGGGESGGGGERGGNSRPPRGE